MKKIKIIFETEVTQELWDTVILDSMEDIDSGKFDKEVVEQVGVISSKTTYEIIES